jgi:hypothetical protein
MSTTALSFSVAGRDEHGAERHGHSPNGLPSLIAQLIPDTAGALSDEYILPFGTYGFKTTKFIYERSSAPPGLAALSPGYLNLGST